MKRTKPLRFAPLLGIFFFTCIEMAEAEHLIPYQGYLTRPTGGQPGVYEAVPDGEYDILFALYASPVGGGTLVWGPERHEELSVRNGFVVTHLGSVIGFESVLNENANFFSRVLYVGVTIDADGNANTTDPELVPRQGLMPALVSWNTDQLTGSDWETFIDGVDGNGKLALSGTKAKNSNLFDGIDSAAVFVDPDDAAPKAIRAETTDAISGDFLVPSLQMAGDFQAESSLVIEGTVTTDLIVNGEISAVSGGVTYHPVPRGLIMMWSGLVSEMPPGWALCDGENGTPDLRSRFVRGGEPDPAEARGGASHTHSFSDTTGNRSASAGVVAFFNSGSDWFTETHNHSLSGTTGSTSNRPPYYNLAYIMRL